MKFQAPNQKPYYVETPAGIFTASGNWYHTTESDLQRFAAPLLEHEPLLKLLQSADRWVRAPQTVTIWIFPLLLLLMPILPAVAAALLVFFLLALFTPTITSFRPSFVLHLMDLIGLQFALYLIILTYLALYPDVAAVVAGLSVFIVLRWRLLDALLAPLVASVQRKLYALPAPDQILRALLLKGALVRGVTLPQFKDMEDHMIRNLSRRSPRF